LSILADERLISGYEKYGLKRWAVVYPMLSLLLVGTLFWLGGWMSVVYLLLSHFHGHQSYQPSSSLYGWSNQIYFNFCLHTEHHDIMGIPWSRLGKLHQIAPEFYDDLVKTESYRSLAYRFMFGNAKSLEEQFDNQDHRNREFLTANSPGGQ
jgi:sphingolipid delta-4 desaturase